MATKDDINQIDAYLSNEVEVYNAWYKGFQVSSKDTEGLVPFSGVLPLDLLKSKFQKWFGEEKEYLKQNLCNKFLELKKKKKFSMTQAAMVAIVADLLGTLAFQMPINVLATASILVTEKYLDSICTVKKNDKPPIKKKD